MSAGRTDFHRRVRKFLESVGADEIAFVDGKKHGRFVFDYQGKKLVVHCSSSPSCPFAHKHVMGDINRLIRSVQ